MLAADDLTRLLRERDPSVVLVPPRILRRVIKRHRRLGGLGLRVPHARLYCIDRAALLDIVSLSELGSAGGVPERVLLLPRLDGPASPAQLRAYWRLLFHAAAERAAAGLDPGALRQRIEAVGVVAFEEAREVLRQEAALFDPHDDAEVYAEFAAVWLELLHFEPERLGEFFPAADRAAVSAHLASLIDHEKMFEATKPPGAADPEPRPPEGPEAPVLRDSDDRRPPGILRKRAELVEARGNLAAAAVLRYKAARALAGMQVRGQSGPLHADARRDIDKLSRRLQIALGSPPNDRGAWARCLESLLPAAALGRWNVEQRLLYDLQSVCLDNERTIYAVDVIEWVVTAFQRPIVRELPHQPLVLTVKHLRTALGRLPLARMPDDHRQSLRKLIESALASAEQKLRKRLHQSLVIALFEVGLVPENIAEKLSRDRLVDDLLDQVVARSYLTIGDLRDAISRSRVKLPDMVSPITFVKGDALLQLNNRLARDLDGIYHRGEAYLRWLQSLSSLFFGNPIGRAITLYFLLPLLGAFFILKGVNVLMEESHKFLRWPSVARFPPAMDDYETGYIAGPPRDWAVRAPELWDLHAFIGMGQREFELCGYVAMGVFLLLMLHWREFRLAVLGALGRIWHGVYALFHDLPVFVLERPLVRAILESRPYLLFWAFVAKPVLWALPVWLLLLWLDVPAEWLWGGALGAAVLFSALMNTRLGLTLQETAADEVARWWRLVRENVVPELFRAVLWLFRRLLERIDQAIYAVDEMLRFRAGDTTISLVVKAALGVVWYVVTYVVRFVVIVLLEPQINPIKHFPVVTVGHKLSLLLVAPLAGVFVTALGLPPAAASTFALTVLGLIPGLYGFLAWELKENWRLYKANQSPTVDPEMIGSHGERFVNLLRPGFHSGTLPKLYAKLRHAQGPAWRKAKEGVHHVEDELRHFFRRELIDVLEASKGWNLREVPAVARLDVATNRVRAALECKPLNDGALLLEFELLGGRLVAEVASAGWAGRLDAWQRAALADALAGMYKKAGVERVGAQDFTAPLSWARWVEVWRRDQAGEPHEPPAVPGVEMLPAPVS